MIGIKRVYAAPAKEDGWRVLVDRLWPRGMKKEAAKIDLWMKDVAPSDRSRKSYGHDFKNWPDFQTKYRAELKRKKDLLKQLKEMEKKHGKLTLLFGAKDEEYNQAVVLAKVLKSDGMKTTRMPKIIHRS